MLARSGTSGRASGPGHGGAVPYVAQGVHFNGSTFLTLASLASINSGVASGFVCINATGTSSGGAGTYWDGGSGQNTYMADGNTGSDIAVSYVDGGTGFIASNFTAPVPPGTWFKYQWAVNLQTNTLILYRNEIPFGTPSTPSGLTGASIAALNGFPFYVGTDGTGHNGIFDMANFWFFPNVFLDPSIAANRRRFSDAAGKPIFLGTHGELPTGTSPPIFLSAARGNPASFSTNLGPGGTLTTTGALTLAATNP